MKVNSLSAEIWAAVIGAVGTVLGASVAAVVGALLVNVGLDRALNPAPGPADIGFTVGSLPASGKPEATAFNYGEKPGTLSKYIYIVAFDASGGEISRRRYELNAGLNSGQSPYTLVPQEGRRYFLEGEPAGNWLPDSVRRCSLEFSMMASASGEDGMEPHESASFDCGS